MNPQRGICPECTARRLLTPAGVLVVHSSLVDGIARGRCVGTGAAPLTDPERVAALTEAERHRPGSDGRCRQCSTYLMPRTPGAAGGRELVIPWPCPTRHRQWAKFQGKVYTR